MFSEFSSPNPAASPTPQPGEIWELSRTPRHPGDQPLAYSLPAQRFLQGHPPVGAASLENRYVLIICEQTLETDPPEINPIDRWQTFTVMVLSPETQHLSDLDILIPISLSGLETDLLAETWHLCPMLGCNLQAQRGHRLSRAIYDCLMDISDASSPITNPQTLGLTVAPPLTHQQPNIQAFHQQERAWADILHLPFNSYQTHLRALQWADRALAQALQTEKDRQQLNTTPISRILPSPRTALTQWLNQEFAPEWQALDRLTSTGTLYLTTPTRDPDDPPDPGTIQTLIERIQSAPDNDTLWAAVEELWQLDPGNPAAGVRRVRLLDLGLQVSGRAVALAIAILHRADQRFGIMLRVYPTETEPYVPENLKLILLDESGQTYEVIARRNDLYIQLKFNGNPGERFGVRVALDDAQITEEFVL